MSETKRARVPMRRLLELARPELGILSAATVALLVSSGMGLAYPQAVKWMIDGLGEGTDSARFDQAALILIVLFFVQAVFSMFRSWWFTVAGERVVARLRTQLYAAIVRQEVAFFDGARTGELTNRLASDTTVLQNTVTVNLSMALRFGVSVIGGVVMLFWMSPMLALVSLLVVPVVAIGAAIYGRAIRRLSSQVQDALATSTEIAEETLGGIRTVRAFAREGHEIGRYDGAVQLSYRLAAQRALAMGVFNGVAGFAGYGAIALVVWYGGRLVVGGSMTMGDLTAFLLYTLLVAFSLGALSNLWGDFARAAGSSERVFELMDATKGIESGGGTVPAEQAGALAFEGVDFTYPTRPDVPVLRDLSFAVAPGEAIALVGPSGSGKSTVAALLSRFYDPNGGRILLDGLPLTEWDVVALRERVGVVSQEPILFATSIAENIRYGRPEATDEEVRLAAVVANAAAFVEAFPDGFQTLVGERGVRLSGGQKQRIAIARAVLKDPRVLVLDEATSALDSESEHLVQEALDRLMEGRTTLVIAHRLSTVRGADRVLVLEDGRLVQIGNHDALMADEGLYRRLVERQVG